MMTGNESDTLESPLAPAFQKDASAEFDADGLSQGFTIDPREPWVAAHNREAREVWNSYNADRPVRVPVIFSGARTVFLEQNHIDYRTYYGNPWQMLRLQLEWNRLGCELPLGDAVLGELPERWHVAVDFHPVASAASFGCPVVFRPDAVPAHESLHLSREQCRAMPMPDLFQSGLLPRHAQFNEYFDRVFTSGLTFMGRPVVRVKPTLPSGGGGVFSTALDIRGPEIMSDMYDDPDFVRAFLGRIAEWRIALSRAWTLRDNLPFPMDAPGAAPIEITDHGIDMLSPQLYDEFLAALILKLCKKYRQPAVQWLHHCGRGTHLFPLIKQRFGLNTLHALTWPLNDIGRVRRELGYDITIVAVISDTILASTPQAIHTAVKDFLTPEVKGKGRLQIWMAGEVTGIPVENYRALYEAVLEYGRY